MAERNSYLDFVTEHLSSLGDITVRSMMGGHTLYCNGFVFAIIANSILYLKVDDGNRLQFEQLGLKPFQPFPDKPGTMSYYPPPAAFFEDEEEMRRWAGGAIAAGRSAAARKKTKPMRKAAPGSGKAAGAKGKGASRRGPSHR